MAFLKKHSMQHIFSTPSHQADSPWSAGILTLGSFPIRQGSSSRLLWTPVDLQPCPRYERLQHGLSMWFSLHSDCHRLVSSLPNCFKCLPRPSGWPWTRGSLQVLQPLHSRCRFSKCYVHLCYLPYPRTSHERQGPKDIWQGQQD